MQVTERRGVTYPVVPKGAILRDFEKDGLTRFNPPVISLKDSDYDPSVFGKNVGGFYTLLFASAYHGKPTQNGNGNFHPDVERETLYGNVKTEIKGVSTNSGNSLISFRQMEKYLDRTLEDGERGVAPTTDFAIFRYGNRNTYVSKLSPRQTVATLARETKDMTWFPSNLVYAIMVVSPKKDFVRKDGFDFLDSERYGMIRGGERTQFHRNPEYALENLRGRLERELEISECGLKVEDFFLENIRFSREYFPSGIRVWGHNVRPFPVLRADSDDVLAWNERYSREKGKFIDALEGKLDLPV